MDRPDRSRIVAGMVSAVLESLIVFGLLVGLRTTSANRDSSRLVEVAFTKAIEPRTDRQKPDPVAKHSSHQLSGGGRARAAPVEAVVPQVALTQLAVPASAIPDVGFGSRPGLSDTGSGNGAGSGNGSGANGAGDSGDGGGSDAEWISGRIDNSDYPGSAADRGAQGITAAEVTVGSNGRASNCQIVRSSGDSDLDATTCRLIIKRFHFRPATDNGGRPVEDTVEYDQEWVLSRATGR